MENIFATPISAEETFETDTLSKVVFAKVQESWTNEETHKSKLEVLQGAEAELKIQLGLKEAAKRNIKDREVLAQQLRQTEEQNTSLRKQLNELYEYCEVLHKENDGKRLAAEERLKQARAEIAGTTRRFEEDRKRMGLVALELTQAIAEEANSAKEKELLRAQIDALTEQLQQKIGIRDESAISLERGKEFVDLATKSLAGFFNDFQNYLESIEKNGVTPINQRAGKLLVEHWNLQRRSLEKTSRSIHELMSKEASL